MFERLMTACECMLYGPQALLCADVLPTGWFCAERAGIQDLLQQQAEVTAAVVGCGPVGLAAVAAAVSLGATRVRHQLSLPRASMSRMHGCCMS